MRAEVFVCVTSAVRALVPAISAVRDSIAQLAHMDANIWIRTAIFIDRALVHSVVGAWKQAKQIEGDIAALVLQHNIIQIRGI